MGVVMRTQNAINWGAVNVGLQKLQKLETFSDPLYPHV